MSNAINKVLCVGGGNLIMLSLRDIRKSSLKFTNNIHYDLPIKYYRVENRL